MYLKFGALVKKENIGSNIKHLAKQTKPSFHQFACPTKNTTLSKTILIFFIKTLLKLLPFIDLGIIDK